MNKLFEEYPNFIPELKYDPEEYILVHHKGWKKKLISKYSSDVGFDINGLIYTLYKSDNRKSYSFNLNMGYAASNYNYYLKTGQKKYLDCFMNIVNWLCKTFNDSGDYGGWLSEHFIYGCKKPYLSSLTQGRGISLIIRAHSIEKKEEFRNIANKALKSFEILSNNGGVLKKDGNDFWYLEYPCNIFDSIVLNGFITSLTGPYDYYKYFDDEYAKKIFNRGITTLVKNIQKFELDLRFFKWTRYDDKKLFFASGNYHEIHIDQLEWLFRVTGEEILKEYANRWRNFLIRYRQIAYWFEVPYMLYKKIGETK